MSAAGCSAKTSVLLRLPASTRLLAEEGHSDRGRWFDPEPQRVHSRAAHVNAVSVVRWPPEPDAYLRGGDREAFTCPDQELHPGPAPISQAEPYRDEGLDL